MKELFLNSIEESPKTVNDLKDLWDSNDDLCQKCLKQLQNHYVLDNENWKSIKLIEQDNESDKWSLTDRAKNL